MEIPQLRSIYVFAKCFVELIICLCYNIISLLTQLFIVIIVLL